MSRLFSRPDGALAARRSRSVRAAAGRAAAEMLEGRTLFAAAVGTNGVALSRFDTATLTTLTTVPVAGMQPGETLVGIDYRPANGLLYGVGSGSRVYTLDPLTGAATQVGASGAFALNGTAFGTDFNPQADRVRQVSNTEQSLRLNPNDGSLAGSDTPLNPAGNVVAVAYDRNDNNAATPTTLFGIDSAAGTLVMIGGVDGLPSPNGGVVTTVGSLGLGTNLNENIGFDIGADGVAYATITTAGVSRLYTVNLATGAATLSASNGGTIGTGATPFLGFTLAVASPFTPADLVVTNANDSGPGSFRNAISAANALPTDDTITFNIPGAGVHTIGALTSLPQLTDPVTIDGYTQPGATPNTNAADSGLGSNAVIRIELDFNSREGFNFGNGSEGSVIRGLSIGDEDDNGIEAGADRIVIVGNFIGLRADGVTPFPNGSNGVLASANDVRIGGTDPADRNVISGNPSSGISLEDAPAVIQGNLIGTDRTGTLARGNGRHGIEMEDANGGVLIGGATAAARNVISGNTGAGIRIDDSAVQVFNNYIGTDVTGTATGLGNGEQGVWTRQAEQLQIGSAGAGNLIRSNGTNGIELTDTDGAVVAGNVVRGNGNSGIVVSGTDATIGGAAAGAGNVVGENSAYGIVLFGAQRVTVQRNQVGTDSTGADLGNTRFGITVDDTNDVTIGGPLPALGNVIAFNGRSGIGTIGHAYNAEFRLNSIYSNDELGIDLAQDGVTTNDLGDVDSGDNNGLQNFPVLASAIVSGGLTTVQGSLNSNANRNYLIDFYGNSAFDPSTFGEGQTYLGTVAVTTNGSGNATFSAAFPVLPVGQYVTATATVDSGSPGMTSEFSQGVQVIAPPIPPTPPNPTIAVAADVSQNEGTGANTTFTFTVTRSGDTTAASTVNFATADGTATTGSDYFGQSGTLTFAAGETSKTINVTVVGDAAIESDEQFVLNLTGATGGTIGDNQAVATVVNDDFPPPAFSISDAASVEGTGPGTTGFAFVVTRSGSAGSLAAPSSVRVQTANGSATAGSDYTAVPLTTLTFAAGETSKQVVVTITHDATYEADETFFVDLSNPTNGTIADGQGVGTIQNDDASPPASVAVGLDPNGKKALIINATEGDDDVSVDPGSKSSRYRVTINGVSYGEFDTGKFDRILMYLKGGADFTGVSSKVTKDAFVFGGDGDDEIDGGSGRDVIVGGAGNDSLEGKKGRDVVIGGDGLDALFGDEDDDLLIAAATTYDADFAGLVAIQREWVSSNSFSKRVSNLKTGSGSNLGGRKLADATVLDDLFADVLRGSASSDAFFVQTTAGAGVVKDTVVDKSGSDAVTDVN